MQTTNHDELDRGRRSMDTTSSSSNNNTRDFPPPYSNNAGDSPQLLEILLSNLNVPRSTNNNNNLAQIANMSRARFLTTQCTGICALFVILIVCITIFFAKLEGSNELSNIILNEIFKAVKNTPRKMTNSYNNSITNFTEKM